MLRALLLGTVLCPGLALACGGKTSDAADKASCEQAAARDAADADPTQSAHKPELVGHNCSYTTAMMAQRVVDDGAPYSYVGRLAPSENALESRVAAPFTFGPEGARVHVLANEVLDTLDKHGATDGRLDLRGRILEVDGVTYFVATTYRPGNS